MLKDSNLGARARKEAKIFFCKTTPGQYRLIEKISFTHGGFRLSPEESIGLPIAKNSLVLYKNLIFGDGNEQKT